MRVQMGVRVALLLAGLVGTVVLAACTTTGVPASSHHVVSTTTVPAVAGQPGLGSALTTPATANPIDSSAATATVNEVQGDLASIDGDLSQVSSDLSNPQGDS